jgi:hypothetical protein
MPALPGRNPLSDVTISGMGRTMLKRLRFELNPKSWMGVQLPRISSFRAGVSMSEQDRSGDLAAIYSRA